MKNQANTLYAFPLPEGVEPEVWSDFLKIRKAKRAAMTATALKGIQREADKAGMSLQSVLEMCCERGWQGFNASWLAPQRGGFSQKQSAHNGFDRKDYGKGVNDDGSFT